MKWELPKPARKFLRKLGWVTLSSIIAGLIGSVFNYLIFNYKILHLHERINN